MKSLSKSALVTVVCVVMIIGGISGCASPAKAKSKGMTVNDVQIQKQHPYSVQILVEGGSASNPAGGSAVSNKAFAEAVANSIIESKLFSEVKKGDGGDYLLSINIFSIEQQPIGIHFNLTAHIEVGWNLVNAVTGKQVMRKAISSSSTATGREAFTAVTIIRLATEGAVRKNIKEGIQEISKLDL